MTDAEKEALMFEASRLLHEEKSDQALASVEHALAAVPDDSSLLLLRGYCLAHLGEFADARAASQRLRTLGSEDAADRLVSFLDSKGPPARDRSTYTSKTLALKLEGILSNVEKEISEYRKRELEAKSTITALKACVERYDSSRDSTVHEVAELKRQLEEAQREIESVAARTASLAQGIKDSRQKELDAHTRERDDAMNIAEQLSGGIESLKSEGVEAAEAQAALKEDLAGLRAEADEDKTTLRDQVMQREERVSELQRDLETRASRIEVLQEAEAVLGSQVAEIEAKLSKRISEVDDLRETEGVLGEKFHAAEKNAEHLKARVVDFEARNEDLKKDASDLENDKASLEKDLLQMREAHQQSASTIHRLNDTLVERGRALAALREEKKCVEAAYSKLGEDVTMLEAELAVQASWEEAVSKDLAQLRRDLQEKDGDLGALRVEKTTLEEQTQSLRSELDGALRAHKDQQQSVETLEADLDSRNREIDNIRREHSALQARISSLESDLELVNTRYEEASIKLSEFDILTREGELRDKEQHEAIDRIHDALEQSRSENAQFRASIEGLEQDKRALQAVMAELPNEFEALRKKELSAQSRSVALTDALAELQTNEANLRESLDEIGRDMDAMRMDLADRLTSLEQAEITENNLREGLSKLRTELDNLRTKELPEALEQKVEAFREARDLRAEIELLRSQIW